MSSGYGVNGEMVKMTERKEDWVKIQTPDNKEMIASANYIKKLLTIGVFDVENLNRKIEDLNNRIKVLERPQKKKRILKLLETGEWHNRSWLENHVPHVTYWMIRELIDELCSEGKLQTKKSGTQPLYTKK